VVPHSPLPVSGGSLANDPLFGFRQNADGSEGGYVYIYVHFRQGLATGADSALVPLR
jgi:hypothetical protein